MRFAAGASDPCARLDNRLVELRVLFPFPKE